MFKSDFGSVKHLLIICAFTASLRRVRAAVTSHWYFLSNKFYTTKAHWLQDGTFDGTFFLQRLNDISCLTSRSKLYSDLLCNKGAKCIHHPKKYVSKMYSLFLNIKTCSFPSHSLIWNERTCVHFQKNETKRCFASQSQTLDYSTLDPYIGLHDINRDSNLKWANAKKTLGHCHIISFKTFTSCRIGIEINQLSFIRRKKKLTESVCKNRIKKISNKIVYMEMTYLYIYQSHL